MEDYMILKLKYKLQAIFSSALRMQIKLMGVCHDCKQPNTGFGWCNRCDPGRFLREGKTSGNTEVDELIHEAQLKVLGYNYNLEWIPYDRFQDIEFIGKGGFSETYSATWLDGIPEFGRTKKRSGPVTVALKRLRNSKNMILAFANEV